jgi:hypothetical protein
MAGKQAEPRIRRANHNAENKYCMIVRSTAQHKELSYEALGLLTYLLSQRDDWEVQPSQLIGRGAGRNRIYKLIKELRDFGYIEYVVHRDEKKRVIGSTYYVNEELNPQNQDLAFQDAAFLDTAFLDTENGHSNKYLSGISTEKEAADAAPLEKPDEKPKQPRKRKPAAPKPVKLRSEEKPYPLYDTVERLIWGIAYDDNAPRQWDDPIGGIAKWLNGDIAKWQKKPYGYISKPAEPRHVEMFVKWYSTKHKGAELPRQFAKFVSYWREWGTAMQANKSKPAIEVMPEPEPTPEELADAAAFIRANRPGAA